MRPVRISFSNWFSEVSFFGGDDVEIAREKVQRLLFRCRKAR